MPSVQDFHAARRMFAIMGGCPVLAPQGVAEGHGAWFVREGWIRAPDDPAFEAIVRGYSDGRDLFAYRGKAFLGDALVEAALRRHGEALRALLDLSSTARFYVGMIPAAPGMPWTPQRQILL